MALVRKKIVEAPKAEPLDGRDGYTAEQIFAGGKGASMDEITFLPGQALADEIVNNIGVTTRICKNAPKEKMLKLPFISAPRPAVTESTMAIALALEGGVGIIHRQQSIKEQAEMVKRVKVYEAGFIMEICVLPPSATVGDVWKATQARRCGSVCITHNGKLDGKLIGLVTTRDIEPLDNPSVPVHTFMTQDIVKGVLPMGLMEARALMQRKKVGKLPIVNKDGELQALVCRGDLKKAVKFPNASRDRNSMLLAAGAIGATSDVDFQRGQALLHAGVDILMLDLSDGGATPYTVDLIRRLKAGDIDKAGQKTLLASDIIAGPVISCKQAKMLLDAGCDGLVVGGPEAKRNEASSLFEIARYARNNYGAPVIADIGARDTAQVAKALCLGAQAVMLDSLLEGTEEAPGAHFYHDGLRMKLRSNEEALPARHPDPIFQGAHPAATGLVSKVVDKGSVADLVHHVLSAVRRTLQELGLAEIKVIAAALGQGTIRMERQISCVSDVDEQLLRTQRITATSLHNRW